MASYRIQQLEFCHTEMFGDLVLTCRTPPMETASKRMLRQVPYRRSFSSDVIMQRNPEVEKRRATALVDQLLLDIYSNVQFSTDYNSATSGKNADELTSIVNCLKMHVERMGSILVRQLKRRDALRRQQNTHCDVITRQLRKLTRGDEDMRFTIQPATGESGYHQWVSAMKMVSQLPGGIPPEFRRRLWLTLAERHLQARGVDWNKVERNCFSEWSHPADSELGVQIVKDLHRTGCSLFCGEDGQENQALLKRVLLAYARWNKAVGYCQGFNMLAALILQVTDKCESEALKMMIYLIEGVLPESYFADSLRGLSVDMAVFRELLRTRLPRLSKHLDTLQSAAKDGNTSYEPPLTNVFTMQWFLTLFCNCLPQPTVLRVWDLIMLEGNEVLLRTALAIWQTLAERIMTVRSADEFYCIMGVLTRELLESDLLDANSLVKAVVSIGPLTELKPLREHYMYNINPWGGIQQAVVDKQLKLYPRERLALDISALKKQYVKLKQRQRQAHIIFSAAISRQPPTNAQKNEDSSSDSSDTELCDEGGEPSDNEEPCQFVHDNPTSNGTNLMKEDNIKPQISATKMLEEKEELETASTSCKVKIEPAESDDENFEFERFLADRVRCLKQHSLPEEDVNLETEKLRLGRRNSERALQIIQENSLILHRILQCQSRLSPSPPLVDANEEFLDIRSSLSEPEIKSSMSPASPEYGNKYTSILEKSKSLDEKYNNLILNQSKTSTSNEGSIVEETLISLSPCKDTANLGDLTVNLDNPTENLKEELIVEKPKILESDDALSFNIEEYKRKLFKDSFALEDNKSLDLPINTEDIPVETFTNIETNSVIDSCSLDEENVILDLSNTTKDLLIKPFKNIDKISPMDKLTLQDLPKTTEVVLKEASENLLTENLALVEDNTFLDLPTTSKDILGEHSQSIDNKSTIDSNSLFEKYDFKPFNLDDYRKPVINNENIKNIVQINNEDKSSNNLENNYSDYISYKINDTLLTIADDTKFSIDEDLNKDNNDIADSTFNVSLDAKETNLDDNKFIDVTAAKSVLVTTHNVEELPMLTIEEIKQKYSKTKTQNSSFYEKSFSDDQKETFSRFTNFKKIYDNEEKSNDTEDPPDVPIEEISPINSKSILDEVKNVENDSATSTCYSYLTSPVSEFYPQLSKSDDEVKENLNDKYTIDYTRTLQSPSPDVSGDKSPSKVFNPFPVSLSSRQSKEVPLKLGLYKK
ncbi:unnamed protein product [Brassicogethes aeneus]|uniref:TBC1 domain family member 30 n=1 Tax=Brassicogethes aeneus TaxID=1431903 RepID=A0A9P0B6Q5_BRAAE|nr:unnamed protein product [Brassicogethes aeneus]